ncbi:nuclear transport factor 2 family protein [Saccharopolyspora gloriosae]|uniref:nuclear transport factor 2 family protein n=1 Tax=Saccharopolyspora gloriosae TaxID=455344 RepID=UPI001FB66B0B|nr:nuclear transport factor 2 family protein [Saccharopolyspora gloriosae]
MSEQRRVQEVLARYVRATDQRNGKAQGALFTADATVQIYAKTGPDGYEKVGEPVRGGAGVEYAVNNFMAPHPEGGSSHHTTSDHIIEIDGDHAHLNAQFIVFEVRALTRPAEGRQAGRSRRSTGGGPPHRVRVLRHGPATHGRRMEDHPPPSSDGHARGARGDLSDLHRRQQSARPHEHQAGAPPSARSTEP